MVIDLAELNRIAKQVVRRTNKITISYPNTQKIWFYGRFENGFPQDRLEIYADLDKKEAEEKKVENSNPLRFVISPIYPIIHNNTWLLTGKFVEYYSDGKTIKREGNCRDGLLHGEVKHYRENGIFQHIFKYEYGFLESLSEVDEEGNKKVILSYDRKTAKIKINEQ